MNRDEKRAARRREFARDVKLMKRLGVCRWGAIMIDPRVAPAGLEGKPIELTPEQIRERQEREEQRRRDVLFASTSRRPIVNAAERVREIPKSVVQGAQASREHDNGAAQES